MSLETILSERETLLSNVEEAKSEIADIELKMSAISDEQLSPIEQEIQQKQNELDRIKKMSGYSDLSNKKKDLNKGIEKKLKDSKMFVYKYLVVFTIAVDGDMSTYDSHKLANHLEKDVEKLDKIDKAVVHVHPVNLY